MNRGGDAVFTVLMFLWQVTLMWQTWNLNARLNRMEYDAIGNDGLTDAERWDSLTKWHNTYAARPTTEEIAALKQQIEGES